MFFSLHVQINGKADQAKITNYIFIKIDFEFVMTVNNPNQNQIQSQFLNGIRNHVLHNHVYCILWIHCRNAFHETKRTT